MTRDLIRKGSSRRFLPSTLITISSKVIGLSNVAPTEEWGSGYLIRSGEHCKGTRLCTNCCRNTTLDHERIRTERKSIYSEYECTWKCTSNPSHRANKG